MFTSTRTHTATPSPRARHHGRATLAVIVATAAMGGSDIAAAAAPVPCRAAGGGHYNCVFYPKAGAPVQAPSGAILGTLHAGTNWVVCQRVGSVKRSSGYYNNNWAWTLADNNRWGWVNAVHARGGANNGPFGGVPNCGYAHGNPPYIGGGGPRPI